MLTFVILYVRMLTTSMSEMYRPTDFEAQLQIYDEQIAARKEAVLADPESYSKQILLNVAHFKAGHLASKAASVGIHLPVSEESIAIYEAAHERFSR